MIERRDGVSEPCPHVALQDLGSDQDAEFLRCQACGAVFVVQGGRAWAIPGAPQGK
jgi:hypothetical protein